MIQFIQGEPPKPGRQFPKALRVTGLLHLGQPAGRLLDQQAEVLIAELEQGDKLRLRAGLHQLITQGAEALD